MIQLVTLLALVVLGYALLSRFLPTSPITMPIFCVGVGVIAGGSLLFLVEAIRQITAEGSNAIAAGAGADAG